MNLIILASGVGRRLNKKLPKCLNRFKQETFLDLILKSSNLFKKIIIVAGYKSNLIKKEINKKKNKKIIVLNNNHFKTTNMVESFFHASKYFNDDLIVSYSDIVFDPKILKNLKKKRANCIPLKLDWLKTWKKRMKKSKIMFDAENVEVDKKCVIEIGTEIKKKLPKFQFMGIIKFEKNCLNKIYRFYKVLNNKKIDFTNFLNLLIKNDIIKLRYTRTSLFWFEVDTKNDLLALRKMKRKW